jgi:hypothetical protein
MISMDGFQRKEYESRERVGGTERKGEESAKTTIEVLMYIWRSCDGDLFTCADLQKR